MGCHHAHRIAIAVSILNLGPADSICIITGPYLREITENSQIKAVAARRTSLEKDMRELLCQSLHDSVKSDHIPVAYFSLLFCRYTLGEYIRKVTVIIPFYIAHPSGRKNLRKSFDQIILNLGL